MSKLVVFGDSITKGVIYDEDRKRYHNLNENFLDQYAKLTQRELKNHSLFGATIAKGQSVIQRFLGSIEPDDEVIVMYGGNDCNFDWKEVSEHPEDNHIPNTPLEIFRENYRELIQSLLSRTQNIVLSTLPPLEYRRFFSFCSQGLSQDNILKFLGDMHHIYRWQEMYHLVVCDLATEFKLKLLDLRLPFLQSDDYQDYFCLDGMHPNQKGQELMLKALLND